MLFYLFRRRPAIHNYSKINTVMGCPVIPMFPVIGIFESSGSTFEYATAVLIESMFVPASLIILPYTTTTSPNKPVVLHNIKSLGEY